MAKNAVTPATPRSPLVALSQEMPYSAEFLEEARKRAGEGTSQRSEDNLIPLIYLLQDGSPQIKPRDPKYIDGAQAGDILLSSLNRVYKGTTGILFQPAHFDFGWGEWVPRDKGGGFRGFHMDRPPNAEEYIDPKSPQRPKWRMPDGNELVETRRHFGFILDPEMGPMQALLNLTSTGHAVSRAWMTQMNTKYLPTGERAPTYFKAYLLTSVIRKNNNNPDTFTYQVMDAGWVSQQQAELGQQLRRDVVEGNRVAATPDTGAEASSEGDDEAPF